ncbi:hypothetical protein FN846DRAFT_886183 [Sphaerosporella brunnea]|uniref:Uncharacterized protein n=1 Tax=Sphaerosporella brunnea TaxID=1250544 RepID=A0A5J5FAF6_9PEZI|nr:hypothetical protein FN846DRAFT_886183 [Sphaerosporella brunnea]
MRVILPLIELLHRVPKMRPLFNQTEAWVCRLLHRLEQRSKRENTEALEAYRQRMEKLLKSQTEVPVRFVQQFGTPNVHIDRSRHWKSCRVAVPATTQCAVITVDEVSITAYLATCTGVMDDSTDYGNRYNKHTVAKDYLSNLNLSTGCEDGDVSDSDDGSDYDSDEAHNNGADAGHPNKTAAKDNLVKKMNRIDLSDLDSVLTIMVMGSRTQRCINKVLVGNFIFSAGKPEAQLIRTLRKDTGRDTWKLVSFKLTDNKRRTLAEEFSQAPGAANQQHWDRICGTLEEHFSGRCTGILEVTSLMGKGNKAGAGCHVVLGRGTGTGSGRRRIDGRPIRKSWSTLLLRMKLIELETF